MLVSVSCILLFAKQVVYICGPWLQWVQSEIGLDHWHMHFHAQAPDLVFITSVFSSPSVPQTRALEVNLISLFSMRALSLTFHTSARRLYDVIRHVSSLGVTELVSLIRSSSKGNRDGALGAAWPSLRSTSAPDTAWVGDLFTLYNLLTCLSGWTRTICAQFALKSHPDTHGYNLMREFGIHTRSCLLLISLSLIFPSCLQSATMRSPTCVGTVTSGTPMWTGTLEVAASSSFTTACSMTTRSTTGLVSKIYTILYSYKWVF